MRSAIAVIGLALVASALTFSLYMGSIRERVDQLEHATYVCVPSSDGSRVCEVLP